MEFVDGKGDVLDISMGAVGFHAEAHIYYISHLFVVFDNFSIFAERLHTREVLPVKKGLINDQNLLFV